MKRPSSLVRSVGVIAVVVSTTFASTLSAVAFRADGPDREHPDWAVVLAHDSTLRHDAGITKLLAEHGRKHFAYVETKHAGGVYVDGTPVTEGTIGPDAVDVVAIPLQSTGSAGVTAWLLYGESGGRHIAEFDGRDHERLAFVDGDVVITSSSYGPNDPECCPNADLRERWTIAANGTWRKTSSTLVPLRKQH